MLTKAKIFDNFLPEERALAFRNEAISLPYYDIRFAGSRYTELHIRGTDELKPELEALVGPIDQQYSFFRRNFKGQFSKDAVHEDTDTSAFVAIMYLNLPEQCSGGTGLFQHKPTGLHFMPSDTEIRARGQSPYREKLRITKDWHNPDAWELTDTLDMKFNRLVVYPCSAFHSRWPREAFGTDPASARTIWISFFNV